MKYETPSHELKSFVRAILAGSVFKTSGIFLSALVGYFVLTVLSGNFAAFLIVMTLPLMVPLILLATLTKVETRSRRRRLDMIRDDVASIRTGSLGHGEVR